MSVAATSPDLCAQEPIRIPGGIQPHGGLALFAGETLNLCQGSANLSEVLGFDVACDGGETLELFDAHSPSLSGEVRFWILGEDPLFLRRYAIGSRSFQVSGHRAAQGIILEFEPTLQEPEEGAIFYPKLRRFMDVIDSFASLDELSTAVAHEVRTLTGFDRVMMYRFDEEWNGAVIAEDGDGSLPSYLGLHFPASDIPSQARELYAANRLRLIPTANYEPVPLTPALCPVDGKPLDMSFAALRSVSPVHLQYMRNMGTLSSMSISIIVDRKLWGLISCHSAKDRGVNAQIRAACDFLGRIVAQQIASRERTAESDQRFQLKQLETELVAHLARSETFQSGLAERSRLWSALTNAAGAAVVTDGIVMAAGATPTPDQILKLADWLQMQKFEQAFATDRLSQLWPEAEAFADVASGLVAVSISRVHAGFILWFRPEQVRVVNWGGDPNKGQAAGETSALTPRRSFEVWKQQVHQRARPWSPAEIRSAVDFRSAVIDFVLQRAEERAQFTEELQRTNKELEAFSYSISHDLRAPFRHIVGYAQLLAEEEPTLKDISRHYLDGISRAALSAGQLVDDLLHFSQLGRASLTMTKIDMRKVVEEIRRSFDLETEERGIEWELGPLPEAWGDPPLIRQALFNLADNAIKYSRDSKPPRIQISGEEKGDQVFYSITDNGVGFEMNYVGKLFQVFQRLHRPEEFDGTGIGLALTKRIVERHGGAISAEGAVGKGATFGFSLPKHARGSNLGKP